MNQIPTELIAKVAELQVELAKSAAKRALVSSNLKDMEYDPKTRVLHVTFTSGSKYKYDNVPPTVARSIHRNKSPGRTFNRRVKKGGFGYERVDGDRTERCFRAAGRRAANNPNLTLMKGPPVFKEDTAHFWVEDKKGRVIDPTAKQLPLKGYKYKGTPVDIRKNMPHLRAAEKRAAGPEPYYLIERSMTPKMWHSLGGSPGQGGMRKDMTPSAAKTLAKTLKPRMYLDSPTTIVFSDGRSFPKNMQARRYGLGLGISSADLPEKMFQPQYGALGFEKLPEGYFKHLKANLSVATGKSKKGVKIHRVLHALHAIMPHRLTSHETHEKRAQIYHGSPKKLDEVAPMNLHGDPDVNKAIFGTPSRRFALAYAGDKWDDRHIGQTTIDGEMHIVEMQPGAFEKRFKGKKGYVYSFAPGPQWKERGEGGVEFITAETQMPTARERVHAFKELVGDPKFKLFKFDPKSKEFRQQIRERRRRLDKMTPENRARYMKWITGGAHPAVVEALTSK